jgi:hypothetical protein
MNTIYHAIWPLRDRPESEKSGRKKYVRLLWFRYAAARRRIPSRTARRILEPVNDGQARYVRALLINNLNR